MKAEKDFSYTDDYKEYLRIYFTAAALSSMGDSDNSPEAIGKDAVSIAEATIKALGIE